MPCRLWLRRTVAGSLRLGVVVALLCCFGIPAGQAADSPWQEPVDVAFTARCDGATERYVVMLPKGLDATRPVDLLVALHGHGSDRWQFIRNPRDECRALRDVAARFGMVYVSPDYRAPASWMGPKAEADVLQVLEELRSRYRMRYTFLCGGSMGASSALTFAALHPERVDGVVALNGTANHVEFEGFQEAIARSFGGTKKDAPDEYRRRSAELAAERLTMPMAATVGGRDKSVPPDSVRRLFGKLKALGRPALLIDRPNGGHATDYADTTAAACFVVEKVRGEGRQATKPPEASRDATAGRRPNFLFIITDDQNAQTLRIYDPGTQLQTPVLDRLAAEGMVIEGAYGMGSFISAVCVPSRHMIKSGRTLWHLPATLTSKSYRDYPAGRCPADIVQNTIAAVFNRAGYATMRTGKAGTSYEEAKAMFTVRKDAAKTGDTDETGSAWHAERVLEYLRERETGHDRKPFFIYLGFSHPHDPRNGKPELLAKYGAVNHGDPSRPPPLALQAPPLPANYLPAHPFDLGQPGGRDETQVLGVWSRRDEATIRNETGRYFACCENVDIQMGRVLEKLKTLGEWDNTYVIFTGDNGIAIGRHGLQGKQHLYEESWRVPLVARGPGIKPGSRARGNVYLLDVLGTLCDLAGIPAPDSNEGLSFRAVLEGRQDVVRDVLYGAFCGGTKPGIRAVRQGDWKLVKFDVLDGAVRQTQLFNLAENPNELLIEHHDPRVVALVGNRPTPPQRNLADDPRYAAKRREMESLLLSQMRRYDDPYRLWDQPDDGLKPLEEVPARRGDVRGPASTAQRP